ncbi:hypothetical protein CFOL_v3_33594 [Cephalotus follicularis]|uniref:Uncharacterized protein n=1 Tax=Cephalotus follicularis TaxID=3775 RepID=A0A1Q3DCP2_CEPFO|nr:hypothetical protein CFOL_v3_33594 [Cephalotus follicularis]
MTMETLVVVAQHRNQYYGRVKQHVPARFNSSPSRDFGEINCRTFQSGAGILPTPFKTFTSPVTKRSFSSSSSISSRTPSPASDSPILDKTPFKTNAKSSPVPINIKTPINSRSFNDNSFCNDNLSFSELWAGPAYSNSPPPSSLPIPRFSLRPKRTVSLDFPASETGIKLHPIAKSAPASPTREHNGSSRHMFVSPDSATRTLRRILNLDNADD